MASKCKKSKIWPYRPWKMTFRAIQPNLSFDMWFMSPQRSSMPKKKKSYWSVSEIDPSPPQSWRTDGQTDRRTDGQTDGQTDRRTTDKSVLEKLRCLSAGGAKKWLLASYIGKKKFQPSMVLKICFCLWKHVTKIFQPDQTPPPPPLEVKWSLPYVVSPQVRTRVEIVTNSCWSGVPAGASLIY